MHQRIACVLILLVMTLFLAFSTDHPSAALLTSSRVVSPEPGLQIYGIARQENGQGVPGVAIYRAFAGYQGTLVATTDASGHYQSEFVWIPGDEMIRVWAELPAYEITPEYYFWRHYYGSEIRELDFTARPILDHIIFIPFFGSP